MRPFLIVFILFLIGFEILILFPKQTEKIVPPESLPMKTSSEETSQVKPQQRMQGTQIHLVESQSGSRDWELFAQSAQSDPTSSTWDLKSVRTLFYNNEKQSIVLTGDQGQIDTQTKNMKITGNVHIETSNGYLFIAPYVEYTSKGRLIFCSSVVQVKGPQVDHRRSLFLKGTGMRIPVTEQKMYLDRDVSGEKIFDGDKTITLKSDQAELSSLNQMAQFINHVVIHYPPMVMTGDRAMFSYSEKSHSFEYLDLTGNVELKDGDRRAVSQKLRIDMVSHQLVFSGQPRLYQGEDELTGDQIIFIDNGKKVKVENVRLESPEGL